MPRIEFEIDDYILKNGGSVHKDDLLHELITVKNINQQSVYDELHNMKEKLYIRESPEGILSQVTVLERWEKSPYPHFEPKLRYYKDGDFMSYFIKDESCYTLGGSPAIYYNDNGEFVGICIHGVKKLIDWACRND